MKFLVLKHLLNRLNEKNLQKLEIVLLFESMQPNKRVFGI